MPGVKPAVGQGSPQVNAGAGTPANVKAAVGRGAKPQVKPGAGQGTTPRVKAAAGGGTSPRLKPGVRNPVARRFIRELLRDTIRAKAKLVRLGVDFDSEAFADLEAALVVMTDTDAEALLSSLAEGKVRVAGRATLTYMTTSIEAIFLFLQARAALSAKPVATSAVDAAGRFRARAHLNNVAAAALRLMQVRMAKMRASGLLRAHGVPVAGVLADGSFKPGAKLSLTTTASVRFDRALRIVNRARATLALKPTTKARLTARGAFAYRHDVEKFTLDAGRASISRIGVKVPKPRATMNTRAKPKPTARLQAKGSNASYISVTNVADSWVNRTKVAGICTDAANHNGDYVRVHGPVTVGPRPREGIVKFQVAGFPNTSVFTEARIRLTLAFTPLLGGLPVGLSELLNIIVTELEVNVLASESWTETTVTCANVPNSSTTFPITSATLSGNTAGSILEVVLGGTVAQELKDRIMAGQSMSFNFGTDELQAVFPELIFYDKENAPNGPSKPQLILKGFFLDPTQKRLLNASIRGSGFRARLKDSAKANARFSRTGSRLTLRTTGGVANRAPSAKGRIRGDARLRAKPSPKVPVRAALARSRFVAKIPKPRATAQVANRNPIGKGRVRSTGRNVLKAAGKRSVSSRGSVAVFQERWFNVPATGTFTVPAGWSSIQVIGYGSGGGGGGGGSSGLLGGTGGSGGGVSLTTGTSGTGAAGGQPTSGSYGGAGGSGARFTVGSLAVTPGQVFNYQVGAGGSAGSAIPGSPGQNGGNGQFTYFTTGVGSGGTSGTAGKGGTGPSGGSGGTGSQGAGQQAVDGTGGAAGPDSRSASGRGGTVNEAGNSEAGVQAGGSGAGGSPGWAGGAGAHGRIIIRRLA